MKKIALIPGDGIGPEIIEAAVRVLNAVGRFEYETCYAGGSAIDRFDDPLPETELEKMKACDAVLMGALGGPKWDNLPGSKRPEAGLLRLRKGLNVFANLRPVKIYPALKEASPLKNSVIGDGIDIMIVRELIGGIYFGRRQEGDEVAYDTLEYSAGEVRRINEVACRLAKMRRGIVTSVDKANVLASSRLWRKATVSFYENHPEITLNHLYVDNAAMQLVVNPRQFDVIVTGNMFGDILSDEASVITGSIGMLPSASVGYPGEIALYEPIHGSAPDIAGKGIANPIATILSAALMLRFSFDMNDEAGRIESAVETVLNKGLRTADLGGGEKSLSTVAMTEAILAELK